jgi:membrane protein
MAQKWKKIIAKWRFVQRAILLLQNLRPVGFQGLSVWYVGSFMWRALNEGGIPTRAAAISFRLFLAFFPGIIMLLSLIPYIPIDNFQDQLFEGIAEFFPGDTFDLFESTLDDLIKKKHNTLLSIGFVLVIYYASNSINAILIGFNSSLLRDDKDNPFLIRAASLVLIFVLGLLMILAITLNVFGGWAFEHLHKLGIIGDRGYIPVLDFFKWVITLFLIYSIITTLYNVGMGARRRRRWKFFNPGATLATLAFVIASIGFAYFVNNFANFNKLYGSLGTLMVLLIWLNFNCNLLLIGFELNASIRSAQKNLPKEPPVAPPAAPAVAPSGPPKNTFINPPKNA